LGAFNIHAFGKSKAAKLEVMEVLGKIIRTCAVVAMQEIRYKSQTALPASVNVVNANSSEPYDYVMSGTIELFIENTRIFRQCPVHKQQR
jgi:hypothetical protein